MGVVLFLDCLFSVGVNGRSGVKAEAEKKERQRKERDKTRTRNSCCGSGADKRKVRILKPRSQSKI